MNEKFKKHCLPVDWAISIIKMHTKIMQHNVLDYVKKITGKTWVQVNNISLGQEQQTVLIQSKLCT